MSPFAEQVVQSHEFQTADLAESTRIRVPNERRRERREGIAVHATVRVPGRDDLRGHTVDLSRGGASVSVPFALALGQQCSIDLELEACGITGSFHIPAEVRYCVEMDVCRHRVGLRFGVMDQQTSGLLDALCKVYPPAV
jgi:c-di-GMP-binding flagellar brake protein YcgR